MERRLSTFLLALLAGLIAFVAPLVAVQNEKAPFVVPVRMGLIGRDGSSLPLCLDGTDHGPSYLLVLNEPSTTLTFSQVGQAPVPSLLRDFTAPVRLQVDLSLDDWAVLLANDTDPFNQWEAAQQMALGILLPAIKGEHTPEQTQALTEQFVKALGAVLHSPGLDPAFKEVVLTLPSQAYLAEQLETVNAKAIFTCREALRLAIASLGSASLMRLRTV